MNLVSPAPEFERNIPFWHQLRWRLMFGFVVLATIPLLTAMIFALIKMRTQTEHQVIDQLESVVELKNDQITRWLDANALVIDGFLSDANHRAELVDLTVSAQNNVADQAHINQELRNLAQLHAELDGSHFHTFFLYNRAGKIIAASDPADLGKVVVNQPYFTSSLGQPFVQPPYYAVGSGALTMIMTRPLRDQQGETSGVLAGQVNLDALGQIMLERTGLGVSGETYLVSQENNYLVTPSRYAGYALNRAYHSAGIDRGLAGGQGVATYPDYRTPPVSVIGSYRWIPALNAALLAEIDESEAQDLFTETATLSLALTAAAALIAALIGLLVATRVSQPITTLAQASRRISAGQLDQRVTISDRGEIGVLATAFNGMTARLQQTLEGLETRVAERTADLQRANQEAERAVAELSESLRQRELLSATVRELATPVVPVLDGILVMPVIGVIDSERVALLLESLLTAIERHRAQVIIIDVTGVPVVDTQVAQVLIHATDAARLLGALPILVGIRPELAQTLVGLGISLNGLVTHADLQNGVRYALERTRSQLAE
ncbi:MAG: HAMP domain-containing protein [Chloroflexi bacterium]|nr:HAMP domain-containing protein [Chloroflexota bacterium]